MIAVPALWAATCPSAVTDATSGGERHRLRRQRQARRLDDRGNIVLPAQIGKPTVFVRVDGPDSVKIPARVAGLRPHFRECQAGRRVFRNIRTDAALYIRQTVNGHATFVRPIAGLNWNCITITQIVISGN